MDELTPRTIAEVTRGDWMPLGVGAERRCVSVFTDSRAPERGGLFVPIAGERFDGHDFIPEIAREATASFVSRDHVQEVLAKLRSTGRGAHEIDLIVVEDSLRALLRLARWYRTLIQARVIAVTGSYGKTTVKEFIGQLLERHVETVRARKSFNNRLGVALTLLSASLSTRSLVAEVGTNAPGEIAELVDLVRPDIGVVTGVAAAHLEGLGDVEGVAREKSDLFAGVAEGGVALLPGEIAGEAHFLEKARAAGASSMRFGWPSAGVSPAYEITRCERLRPANGSPGYRFELNGSHVFELGLPGRHNVFDAVAAIAVARELGLDWASIREGVRRLTLPPLRLQVGSTGGVVIVDDTYNSNPASVAAALSAVDDLPLPNGGRWFMVLGDMLELGAASELIHRRIGSEIAGRGAFSALWTLGPLARLAGSTARAGRLAIEAFEAGDHERLVDTVAATLRPGDGVLFKASRGVALDRVAEALRGRLASGTDSATGRKEVRDALLRL